MSLVWQYWPTRRCSRESHRWGRPLNEVPRQILAKVVARYGRDLCQDARRCEALLRDLCGQYKRENFVIVSVAKEKAAADIASLSHDAPAEVRITQLSERLHEDLGLPIDLARWGVESWAVALGVIVASSSVCVFRCPACAVTGQISTRFAGKAGRCPKCGVLIDVSKDGKVFTLHQEPVPDPTAAIDNRSKNGAEQVLFGDNASISAEDILRATLRHIFADGIVTVEEKAEARRLRSSLGVSLEAANRIVKEVQAELALLQPVGSSAKKALAYEADNDINDAIAAELQERPSSTNALVADEQPISMYKVKKRLWMGSVVTFQCDECGAELTCPLHEAGTRQKCPSCKREFTIPGSVEKARELEDLLKKQAYERERQAANAVEKQRLAEAEKSLRERMDQAKSTAVPSPPPMVWYGSMSCDSCGYSWQARRNSPPARCPSCGRRAARPVREPERQGCLIWIVLGVAILLLSSTS